MLRYTGYRPLLERCRPASFRGWVPLCSISLWVFLLLLRVSAAVAETPLVLAVHPYQSYDTLIRKYTPLAKHLSETLQCPVIVRIGRDYQDHIEYIGTDQVDIALMGPASYVTMVDKHGRKPVLARFEIDGEPYFRGVLVTRRDSQLKNLVDLKGKRIAFGDRRSTMSHLVPRFMLLQAGVATSDLADFRFLGSHDNVALAVLAGDYDAGAIKQEVFDKYRSRGLRALAFTPTFSEHLFVASNGLSAATLDAIRDALYSLSETATGLAIMQGIKANMTGMQLGTDADYDNLREIMKTLHAQGVL